MSSLLLVLPYHSGDAELARKLLTWISELRGKRDCPHSILLVADSQIDRTMINGLHAMAKPLFRNTETMLVPVPKQGWPHGANFMFAAAAKQILETAKLPWFWCEPDCVPLKSGWLDTLATAYAACPKRFMGAIAESNPPNGVPNHMAGCAVYDPRAYEGMKPFTEGDAAFDVVSATYTAPRMMRTTLIQHFWGKPGVPPVFHKERLPDDLENVVTEGFLKPEAVIFHRCKDGSLIDLFREKAAKPAHTTRKPRVPYYEAKKPEPPIPATIDA